MSLVTKPYTFSNGATIIASEHNSALDTLYNLVNGGLDTANLSPTALLALSQISFSQAITMTGNITMSGAITKWAKGADVASSAGSITLGDDGNMFDITGTAAITSITAKTAGTFVLLQFDSTATLTDGSNLSLNSNFTGAAGAVIGLISDGTTWYEVCRSNSTFTPSVSNALSGSVIQSKFDTSSAYDSTTTVLPYDTSAPTVSEGKGSDLSISITPNNTANTLEVSANVYLSSVAGGIAVVAALFEDNTCVAYGGLAGGTAGSVPLYYKKEGSVGTSALVYTVRFGPGSAGTCGLNGDTSGNVIGGTVVKSYLSAKEYKA